MPSNAAYLYCLVKSAAALPLARVPAGLPRAARPALATVGRSLRLVVAEVPLEFYGPGALRESLHDMQWVGEVAVAHESVVEHFARARGATVIPAKLFTMFSSVDRAIASVKAQRAEVAAVMARIGGCAEWGVRITKPRQVSGLRRTPVRVRSGASFLAAKKQAKDDARAALAAGVQAAEDAFEALAALARDTNRRDTEPDGAVAPPLLDAAFLVPAASLRRFKAAARRAAAACARAGSEMTLTGPWPPYNFVGLEAAR